MQAIVVLVIVAAVVASTLATLAAVMSDSSRLQTNALLSPSSSVAAVAQQQQVENATVHTNVTSILNLSTGNKTFYEVNQEIQNFNETKMGFPADIYSRPVLVVNKGDNVTIHFYNIENETTDRHSFTLGAPYNIDKDLSGGENATATFTANQEGVFVFYCKYHMPSMTGELVVLPKPSSSSSSSSSPSPSP